MRNNKCHFTTCIWKLVFYLLIFCLYFFEFSTPRQDVDFKDVDQWVNVCFTSLLFEAIQKNVSDEAIFLKNFFSLF